MSDRMGYLLKEASKALRDGRNPFSEAFLVEHAVTFDECLDLSLTVSAAIDVFVGLTEVAVHRARPPEPSGGEG